MKSSELLLSAEDFTSLTETVLSKKASFRFQVRGYSMLPFMRDKDILTISPISIDNIMIGLPVAFIHTITRKLIIHRIVKKTKSGYLIKGDSAFEADGLISQRDILGSVTKIERNNKIFSFGLGPERLIIALLSRIRFFTFALFIWNLIPLYLRRIIK